MARIGLKSNSLLRNPDFIEYSEIEYDQKGNYIGDDYILANILLKNENGVLQRSKSNIREMLFQNGIQYRMIFNTMNLRFSNEDEIREALKNIKNYMETLGVAGIVEFHPADKTLNSDHIHFWINTEENYIANKLGHFLISNAYSNEEDVFVTQYKDNKMIPIEDYERPTNLTMKEKNNSLFNNDENIEFYKKEIQKKIEKFKNIGAKNESNENVGLSEARNKGVKISINSIRSQNAERQRKDDSKTTRTKSNNLSSMSSGSMETNSFSSNMLLQGNKRDYMGRRRTSFEEKSNTDVRREGTVDDRTGIERRRKKQLEEEQMKDLFEKYVKVKSEIEELIKKQKENNSFANELEKDNDEEVASKTLSEIKRQKLLMLKKLR